MEGHDQFLCVEDLESLLNVAKSYCSYCSTEIETDAVKSCAGEKRFGCTTTICRNCFSAIFQRARFEDFVCGRCPVQASGSRGRHTADTDFSKDVHSPTLVRTLQADNKKKNKNAAEVVSVDVYNALAEQLRQSASQLESMANDYRNLHAYCEQLVEYHAQQQQAKDTEVTQLHAQIAQLHAQVAVQTVQIQAQQEVPFGMAAPAA